MGEKLLKQQSSALNNFKVRLFGALKVNGGVFIALIVLYIIGGLLSPKFLTLSNQLSLLRSLSTTAMCSFAMTLIIIVGQIDLSMGSCMSIAGVLSAVLISRYGWPVLGAVIFTVLVVGIFTGIANSVLINELKMPALIGTMATQYAIRGVSYLISDSTVVSVSANEAPLFGEIGTAYLWDAVPVTGVYVVVTFIVLWLFLNRTVFGRHIYAVGGNRTAAEFSGIKSKRVIFWCFIIMGIVSSFAGVVLTSRLGSGQPTIGEGSEFDAIVSSVVGGVSMNGGVGTLTGTFAGAIIFQTITNLLNLLGIDSAYQRVMKGLIIVAAVYINLTRGKAAGRVKKDKKKEKAAAAK